MAKRRSAAKPKRKKNRENPPEKVEALKVKIEDPQYVEQALARMAADISRIFFND